MRCLARLPEKGKKATLFFDLPRTDLKPVLFDMDIDPANGFKVTAAHNHELFVEPQVFYLHGFHVGDLISPAKAMREALSRTNSKISS